jgi:4-aminobutyrate aminotransferase
MPFQNVLSVCHTRVLAEQLQQRLSKAATWQGLRQRQLRGEGWPYGTPDLLVVDEVQSGIGRTGKWWAVEHTGAHPDIVCSAKGIASGMPLGVVISKAEIMDWIPGSHASTFGGNPICIAAALATLDVIEKEGLLRNSQEVGDYMLKKMADWPKKHEIVGDVRGRGLMIGVEIVKDQKTREYAPQERDRIVELAFDRGILFLGCGPSTVRISPPLVVTKDEADVARRARRVDCYRREKRISEVCDVERKSGIHPHRLRRHRAG